VRRGSPVKAAKQRHRGIIYKTNSPSQRFFDSHLQNRHRMEGSFKPDNRPERFEHAFMVSVVDPVDSTPRRNNQNPPSPANDLLATNDPDDANLNGNTFGSFSFF